jgi:hypothetical protein
MKKHTIDAAGKLGLVLLQSANYMTIIEREPKLDKYHAFNIMNAFLHL